MVKVPPLGECPKDKGGAASGEEAVAVKATEGLYQWSALARPTESGAFYGQNTHQRVCSFRQRTKEKHDQRRKASLV